MRPFDIVRRSTLKILDLLFSRSKQPEFVCVDCERWEQCSLRPSRDCLIRVAQIEGNSQSQWLRSSFGRRWGIGPWGAAF
jgi:hypothetical protein